MTEKIKVLHVLKQMSFGGVETWLMHVLRNLDSNIEFEFAVHGDGRGDFDDEIEQLGGRIHRIAKPSRPLSYAKSLRDVIRKNQYDVIHSHLHLFSGFVLKIANSCNVPVRIAHSHNDTLALQQQASYPKKMYGFLMKKMIDRYATCKVAVTKKAAIALYGKKYESDEKVKLLNYIIDLPLFDKPPVFRRRKELGFTADDLVITHIGSFTEQKNHKFLISVFYSLLSQLPDAKLLLIGDGDLRPQLQSLVDQLDISAQVVFAGKRSDVPDVLVSVSDVFVFPSLWEGFGLVALEAQAAGIPCVISDVVPMEADLVPELVQRLSLSASEEVWAEKIALASKVKYPRNEAFLRISSSVHNVKHNLPKLLGIYRSKLSKTLQAHE